MRVDIYEKIHVEMYVDIYEYKHVDIFVDTHVDRYVDTYSSKPSSNESYRTKAQLLKRA